MMKFELEAFGRYLYLNQDEIFIPVMWWRDHREKQKTDLSLPPPATPAICGQSKKAAV